MNRIGAKHSKIRRHLPVYVVITLCLIVVFVVLLFGVRAGVKHRAMLYGEFEIQQVAQSLFLYAADNNAQFPPANAWQTALITSGYIDAFQPTYWIDHDNDGVIYTYLPDSVHGDGTQILVFDDPDRWGRGVLVGFADGHVELVPHDDFEQMLDQQLANPAP